MRQSQVSADQTDECGEHTTQSGAAVDAVAYGPTPTRRHLAELSRSERRDALEALVVRELKASLLMTEADELPLDDSFFDLGLTSLRMTEIKQRLEQLLGCGINANVLFNKPTTNQLMEHLTTDVLTELFAVTADGAATPATPATSDAQWRDVLDDLYRA